MIEKDKEPVPSKGEFQTDPLIGERKFGIFGGKVVEAIVTNVQAGQDGQSLYTIEYQGGTKDVPEHVFSIEVQADLTRRKAEQDLAEVGLKTVDEPAPESQEINIYDHLLDPNYDGSGQSVEAAAVHQELSEEEQWIEDNIRKPSRVATQNDAINNRADDYRAGQ